MTDVAPKHRRIALVGAGVIGRHHGRVIDQLTDRLDLVAVVDPHLDRAQQIADDHGGSVYASLTEALDRAEIDVVVVCTPTGTHGSWPSRRCGPART